MTLRPLIESIRYGWSQLFRRRLYFATMIVLPLAMTFFLLNIMERGLPTNVPVAMVDLDHSSLSRTMTRNLGSSQMLSITSSEESFHSAMQKVRDNKIFGFFMIPENFEADVVAGRTPTLSYYCNLTYYIPGSLAFKGFKTVAVTTSGGVVRTKLISAGLDSHSVGSLLQPVVINQSAIGNPWINYNYYLSVSFIAGIIALLVMQITSHTITYEIKNATSAHWLDIGGGSMLVALVGKLLPQTLIWSVVGIAIEATLFGFCHFPLNNHAAHMIVAMVLLVIASQSLAVIICSITPNPRLSLTNCSLIGILSFSIAGFSFPITSMYGAIGIFSYILPVRYFFDIFSDQALNGIPLYYSRWYYIALLIFPLVSMLGLRRLKKHCKNPVYVP